jgi:multidrug efflux pump subunit AcrA (membrane-fusion protein)
VRDGKAVETVVQIGRKYGNDVEVISGLETGDKIIDNITDKIQDGTEVEVL